MSDEQRVRTVLGWIGCELSRSRVRTPGKAGYGLYRVRGLTLPTYPTPGNWDPMNYVWSEWTPHLFTLGTVRTAAWAAIERGTPAGPGSLTLAAEPEGKPVYQVSTRWTAQYRGRRDLGVPVVVQVQPGVAEGLTALSALLGEESLTLRHVTDGRCSCAEPDRLTMACADLTMSDADVRERVRLRHAELLWARKPDLVFRCPAEVGPGEQCRGGVRIESAEDEGSCDAGGHRVVRDDPANTRWAVEAMSVSTVRQRQREFNAEFQREHKPARDAGLAARHARKLSRYDP